MVFYITVYLLSAFFSILACNSFKKNNKIYGIILSIIAILIPCIIAGLRCETIGTDTSKYVAKTFIAAQNGYNYSSAMSNMNNVANVEYFYKLITFIISRVTNNVNWMYFIISLITVTLIYLTCYDNRTDKGNYTLAYFSFLVLFFNRSLNLSRQSIAIAILLYSSKFIFKKKFKLYLFFCILAFLFHTTSILFIVLYFIPNLIDGNYKKSNIFLLFSISFLILSQYQNILLYLINDLNILDKRYLFYVIDSSNRGTNMLIIELIFITFLIIVSFIFNKRIKNKNVKVYCIFLALSFVIYLIGTYASYAFRLSYYLYTFVIIIIQHLKDSCEIKNNRFFITILIGIVLCSYSYLYYDVNQFDQTVPYKSILSKEKILY